MGMSAPSLQRVYRMENWEEREVWGGMDDSTSKENLASMGDGEQEIKLTEQSPSTL